MVELNYSLTSEQNTNKTPNYLKNVFYKQLYNTQWKTLTDRNPDQRD